MYTRKRTWMWGGLALVLALVVVWGTVGGGADGGVAAERVLVARGSLEKTVQVVGHAEPLDRARLAFPVGGRVQELRVEEGVRVARGDVLATLEQSQVTAAQTEAQARLAAERQRYTELAAPTRIEERAVSEAALAAARQAHAQADEQARVALSRAYVYADDALREEVDELFGSAAEEAKFGVTFSYGTTDYVIRADAQTTVQLTAMRSDALQYLEQLAEHVTATTSDRRTTLAGSANALVAIETFVTELARVVNRYIPTDSGAQTVYESYQTSVAAARTALATARSELQVAAAALDAADTVVRTKEREFELVVAGASSETLETQRAAVSVAEAAVDAVSVRLSDTTLRAPLAGVVTLVEPTVGETVKGFETVVEVMSEGVYEVVSYIPEVDIADVSLRDAASVMFDAFGDDTVFMAEVIRIALTETVREGVPTYKTTMVLTEVPGETYVLRPGMTADVSITTEVHDNVLVIPGRSVLWEDGSTYVRVWNGGEEVLEEVVTGIRGHDGAIEVVSGLREGQEVLLPTYGL